EWAVGIDHRHRVPKSKRGELFDMSIEKHVGADEKGAGSVLLQCGKHRIEIAYGTRIQDTELNSEDTGRWLQALQIAVTKIPTARVDEHGNSGRSGEQFAQQLQPLRPQLHVQAGHAGNVVAVFVKT